LDIVVEALRVIFVVGLVAIPILYWLSGRGKTDRSQDQNEEKRGERRTEESHQEAGIS
jgi:hypothetical protein